MRIFEKDFRYLLQNLIPQSRLSLERRKEIEGALISGDLAEMRRQSILALEELCTSTYVERGETRIDGDNILVSYSRRGGFGHFLLRVPQAEWRGALEREAPAPQDLQPRAPISAIPEVVRSFSINNRGSTILQKLEALVELLPEWLQFASATLFLVEEKLGSSETDSEKVKSVPEERLLEDTLYAECRRSGTLKVRTAPRAGVSLTEDKRPLCKAIAPIFTLGDFWGILEVLSYVGESPEDIKTKVGVASNIVEQMIENNIRLENLVSIDKLTRVYNRHFYDSQLPIEIERAKRTKGKLSMLLLDIDDFKEINDQLGHKKGDEVLVFVADLIKKNLRKIDLPFRYGGEEFVILLPGTARMEAVHTAERLRSIVSGYRWTYDEQRTERLVSVSIGVAVFPDDASSEEELFVRADMAMLRAKKLGKNRVELYSE